LQPWALAIAAAENAAVNGVRFFLNTKVIGINRIDDAGRPESNQPVSGVRYEIITGQGQTFHAGAVVNAAGIYSDKISALPAASPKFIIKPDIANFLVTDTYADGFISHILFFETEEHGKDIQVVPTVDGNILVSPPSSDKGGNISDRETRDSSEDQLRRLASAASRFLPGFPLDSTIRTFAGLRPNPYDIDSDRSINDLVISEDAPGFISLIGVKTPGLTCANEIGRYVAELITDLLGSIKINPDYDGARRMNRPFSQLNPIMQARLTSEDSAWGEIICRCRQITEQEIRNALRQNPAAATIDAVKHRTGACMGRCQGGYCTQRIIEIIADEFNIKPNSVNQNNEGSYIL
jgi:glycerol-3-phosphate dehydrogenase